MTSTPNTSPASERASLVQRLRWQADFCESEDRLDLKPDAAVMAEAADRIEALEAELAELNNVLSRR